METNLNVYGFFDLKTKKINKMKKQKKKNRLSNVFMLVISNKNKKKNI